MFWLVVGYLFLFIFRPFEYWPILGELRLERVYMIFLLLAVVLWQDKKNRPHPITNGVLLFFLVMVASLLMAFNWDDAYSVTFDYFKLIVFYFVVILTIRDEYELKNFIIAYIAVMFLYVGKSEWEFFVHERHWYRMGIRRLIGIDTTYGHPNNFAASIAFSLPFLWAMIRCRIENRWLRRMLWAYGGLAVVGIIYTGSRAGMVTGILFLLLLWLGQSRKALGIVILTFALIFGWAVMPEKYQARFESIFVKEAGTEGAYHSAQSRIMGLKQGIKMFTQYPVLGIGPGNFKYGWPNREIDMSAHNLYGQVLGELGAAGFLTFFLMVWLIIRTHRKIIRDIDGLSHLNSRAPDTLSPQDKALLTLKYISIASIQAVILMLFNGNFGHNLYRYNWLWIGAIGVLSVYFLDKRKTESREVSLE